MSHTIGQVKQDTKPLNSNSNQSHQDMSKPEDNILAPTSGLSDTDYEFLFNQLLEGVAHGWHDHRIIKFFNQLGDRGKQADWVTWLESFRLKLLKLPIQSKRQLGTMMIRLGELTQSTTEVNQIGAVAHRIGRELLFENIPDIIWEYTGPDLSLAEQIETEQELLARLPEDFTSLGVPEEASGELDSPIVSVSEGNNSPDLDSGDNPWLDEMEPVSLTDSFEAENLNDSVNLEPINHLEDSPPPKVDNSMARGEQTLVESSSDNLDLSQDLDLAMNSSQQLTNQVTDYTEELEPRLESQPLEDSSLEVIESWFNLGLKQVSAGEYTQAIASWDKALSINPNLPEAWHNRGSALGRLGNYEAAVKSFQSALVLDPDNYQAWNDRAHALYQLENWTGAIESWSQAIKIMPGNHLFWYNRGCTFEQLAKWNDAIASYEKALEIKPDFQPARSRYINLIADNSQPN